MPRSARKRGREADLEAGAEEEGEEELVLFKQRSTHISVQEVVEKIIEKSTPLVDIIGLIPS